MSMEGMKFNYTTKVIKEDRSHNLAIISVNLALLHIVLKFENRDSMLSPVSKLMYALPYIIFAKRM